MDRYEYRVIKCDDKTCMEKVMNNIARDGWRVISVIYRAYFHAFYVMTFERKVSIDK